MSVEILEIFPLRSNPLNRFVIQGKQWDELVNYFNVVAPGIVDADENCEGIEDAVAATLAGALHDEIRSGGCAAFARLVHPDEAQAFVDRVAAFVDFLRHSGGFRFF